MSSDVGWIVLAWLLDLYRADGSPMQVSFDHRWTGRVGSIEFFGDRVQCEIPAGSSLVLAMEPEGTGELGWALLRTDGPLGARAELQVAETPVQGVPSDLSFENYLQSVSEIEPVAPIKRFKFPIWLYAGLKQLSTAFSVVNLAGVPGEVHLVFEGGSGVATEERRIRLQSGEFFADFFDRIWGLGFPEIFPFELRASAEVVSLLPLGSAVFTTLQGRPQSGVDLVPARRRSKAIIAELGKEVTLAVGETAWVEAEGFEVEFWNVRGDSRCPVDVVCVWEGEAVIELKATGQGRPSESVTLSTGDEDRVHRHEDFSIELLEVLPAPVSTQQPGISEYRIRLRVSRVGD